MYVRLYTDGACKGNPGRGGAAYLAQFKLQDGRIAEKYGSRGFRLTTNNRMEITAIILGLEAIKEGCDVDIYTDSKYVCDSINQKWVYGWLKKPDFAGKKNKDLWIKLLEEMGKRNVTVKWVKGHSSTDGNNRCDRLASDAAASDSLYADIVFERGQH